MQKELKFDMFPIAVECFLGGLKEVQPTNSSSNSNNWSGSLEGPLDTRLDGQGNALVTEKTCSVVADTRKASDEQLKEFGQSMLELSVKYLL